MIDFNSAREAVLRSVRPGSMLTVSLESATGYVIAKDIVAREPVPAFDSSAVDGYAVRLDDETASVFPEQLPLVGTIRAGDPPVSELQRNTAVRIFTGAVVPASAHSVVMQEAAEELDGAVRFRTNPKKGENIRRRGEEFARGSSVLAPGARITPPVVALLASLGCINIEVYSKPRVSLIITGDEIRPPSESVRKGQVRDSVSHALRAALGIMGITDVAAFHTGDSPSATEEAFLSALDRSDVVLSVGGVSVGGYDFVKDVLGEIGVERIFWKVAMKPGKPNYFGIKNNTLVFGLPGNPVSALVSFYVLVRPALLKRMGCADHDPVIVRAMLTETITKKRGRMEFVRGVLGQNESGAPTVAPAKGQLSHMLGGMAAANCLIHIPEGSTELPASSVVDAELLLW
jgi:molybdopterin molybdotransferase